MQLDLVVAVVREESMILNVDDRALYGIQMPPLDYFRQFNCQEFDHFLIVVIFEKAAQSHVSCLLKFIKAKMLFSIAHEIVF
jgi:hypothetical protein